MAAAAGRGAGRGASAGQAKSRSSFEAGKQTARVSSRETTMCGTIERIVAYNVHTGFCMLRLENTRIGCKTTASGTIPKDCEHCRVGPQLDADGDPQQPELATVVGTIAPVNVGEKIIARGVWIGDESHAANRQFEATWPIVMPNLPESVADPATYLDGGAVKSIGKRLADLLVRTAVDQRVHPMSIMDDQRQLNLLYSVGITRATKISEEWESLKGIRETTTCLMTEGMMASADALKLGKGMYAKRDTFVADGSTVHGTMLANPYRCTLKGVLPFGVAENIATSLGRARKGELAESRVAAAVLHVLWSAEKEGHCGLQQTDLLERASKVLDVPAEEIDLARVGDALEGRSLVSAEVNGEQCYFEGAVYDMERDIATSLNRLATGAVCWNPVVNLDVRVKQAVIDNAKLSEEKAFAATLSRSQETALMAALNFRLTAWLGGAGVGKTWLLSILCNVLKHASVGGDFRPVAIKLCAPTGRAAARLTESTGMPATTIHRLLGVGYDGHAKRHKNNQLKADLVVVDESSMLDSRLLDKLLVALPPHASLLLVGDIDQLPAIGAGDILRSLRITNFGKICRLSEIHRQTEGSEIVSMSRAIQGGTLGEHLAACTAHTVEEVGTLLRHTDFVYLRVQDPKDIMEAVKQLVSKTIPDAKNLDPVLGIQVLGAMRERGPLSVLKLNSNLQQVLNPRRIDSGLPSVKGLRTVFREGDKVMQIVNNVSKAICNGEIGVVTSATKAKTRGADADLPQGGLEAIEVTFATALGNERKITYSRHELDQQLVLAYATTIHKAQGCEYEAVVVVLSTEQMKMLRRSLLYTAVTRARTAVIIVGQHAALQYALMNADNVDDVSLRRCTLLPTLLEEHQDNDGSDLTGFQQRRRGVWVGATGVPSTQEPRDAVEVCPPAADRGAETGGPDSSATTAGTHPAPPARTPESHKRPKRKPKRPVASELPKGPQGRAEDGEGMGVTTITSPFALIDPLTRRETEG